MARGGDDRLRRALAGLTDLAGPMSHERSARLDRLAAAAREPDPAVRVRRLKEVAAEVLAASDETGREADAWLAARGLSPEAAAARLRDAPLTPAARALVEATVAEGLENARRAAKEAAREARGRPRARPPRAGRLRI